ncbi:uncharacterized protein JCM15063_001434 [Sporobolomyces koalae]|uniref:uncharacterized protein n=1 Tax=Sporobolomyces koalae TaxID=500713 RepID=UPI00317CAF96
MSDSLPSPTKRASMAQAPAPARDPTDIRGSMARQAQTGYEANIGFRALQARAAVAQGHTLPPKSGLNARRPLGPSRTEPVLSFSNPAAQRGPTMFPPFQTNQDILNLVYTDGKRPNELQPMWETGSTESHSRSNSRVGSGLFGSEAGFGTSVTSSGQAGDNVGDGDGFDLDEVFGESSSGFGAFSQNSNTTATTQRAKRAHEDEQRDGELGDDDDEMVATDVEDEGEDEVASTLPSMFGGARKIAGKRSFGRTQSLPAQAFAGAMEF